MKTLYTTYNNFAKRLAMLLMVLMTISVGTSIAQDENGKLYVGTGEGFYSESEAGKKHFKTGLIGNGVYESSSFEKNWAANLQSDEEKYQYVANNISFTHIYHPLFSFNYSIY